jgi:hypothetical protein
VVQNNIFLNYSVRVEQGSTLKDFVEKGLTIVTLLFFTIARSSVFVRMIAFMASNAVVEIVV